MIDNDVTYDLNIEERAHLTYLRYIGCTFIIIIDRVDGGKGEYGGGGVLGRWKISIGLSVHDERQCVNIHDDTPLHDRPFVRNT